MTDETKENTEPWIESNGVEYAYCYLDKGTIGNWMKSLGMRGFPSAVLVDPKGTVVWVGSPYSLNDSLIEKHIRGASRTPVEYAISKRWPEAASKVASEFKKGHLAKALTEARLSDNLGDVARDVQRVITRRAEKLKALHAAGDFLAFTEAAPAEIKALKGLPEGAALDELMKSVKADKLAKTVIKAQKALVKISRAINESTKAKELASLIKKLEKVAGKHEADFAGKSASKLAERARKKIEALGKR